MAPQLRLVPKEAPAAPPPPQDPEPTIAELLCALPGPDRAVVLAQMVLLAEEHGWELAAAREEVLRWRSRVAVVPGALPWGPGALPWGEMPPAPEEDQG